MKPTASGQEEHSIANMHVLLVNDSNFELNVLKGLLQIHDFCNISTARTAIEALEMIGILPTDREVYKPDLILMNLIMPYMDGIEACQEIKSRKEFDSLPIIIMTSTDRDDQIKKAFQAGANDFVSIPIREVELISRVETALRLKYEMDKRKIREQELVQVMRQLDKMNKRLQDLSYLDGLTGVYNRRYFEERLNQEWKHAVRYKRPLTLILIDIDFFKQYNDHYGHFLGDECLRRVAETLKASLHRGSDTLARYGGEEFAVILPETDENGAFKVAQKLQENVFSLQIPHRESSVSSFITISVGCCTMIPEPGMNQGQMITQADEMLYQAKKNGRNQVCAMMF